MTAVAHLPTIAARQAERNLRANLRALDDRTDPVLALRPGAIDATSDWEWVFGRDGSLTALDGRGRFIGGCSVPTRAAQLQLRNFSTTASAVCLLSPSHPAEARILLDRMRPSQALIVLLPEVDQLALLLHADDLSTPIHRGRLWLAAGENWAGQLEDLLKAHDGLAIPGQFVRLKSAEAAADRLIEPAQTVFTRVASSRAAAMARLAEHDRASIQVADRVCVVAESRFQLWNTSGHALASVLRDEWPSSVAHFDPDQPLSATPLALANVARTCDVVVAAEVCRVDLPATVAPLALPWITWITRARAIPPVSSVGPRDGLLVTNEPLRAAARAAGWESPRLLVAGWPDIPLEPSPEPSVLGLIADIPSLSPPEQLRNFSSHRLLWEWVESTMRRDPLAAVDSAERLILDGAKRLGIAPRDLPINLFIDGLISPMLAIGVARLLHAAGLPLRLFGDGWTCLEGLSGVQAQPVRSHAQFRSALEASAVLVRAVVSSEQHCIDAVCRPMLRLRSGMTNAELVRSARAALEAAASFEPPRCPRLSAEMIRRVINR